MAVEDLYRGRQGENYHGAVHDIPREALSWVRRNRERKLSLHVRRYDTVLEYGAGLGLNIIELDVKSKVAFDISEHLSSYYRNSDVRFVKDLSSIDGGSFSIIICHHVLEHVGCPLDVLKEIRGFLEKDGKLLLYVPMEQSRRYNKIKKNDKDNHIYAWSGQSLVNLLRVAGFSVVSLRKRRFGYDFFSSRVAVKLRIGELGYRGLKWVLNSIRPVYEFQVIAVKV